MSGFGGDGGPGGTSITGDPPSVEFPLNARGSATASPTATTNASAIGITALRLKPPSATVLPSEYT
ncbi:MAG: hypothetical protein K2K04_05910 [Clostridia bacterium]|nr:hypothetical protein [Clostridia bacterium]